MERIIHVYELKLGDHVPGKGFVVGLNVDKIAEDGVSVTYADADGVAVSIATHNRDDILKIDNFAIL